MGKEEYFISGFSHGAIGDDGAVVGDMVYSKDLFCENIHFKRSWMSLTSIARKSMLVNISDAIAMNARPLHALIGIVIPRDFSHSQLRELSAGFESVAREFGIAIIGGDTTSGEHLMISVTIISKATKPIFRHSMRQGDLVAYTGRLGASKKGLTRLLRGGKLSSKSRFVTPSLCGDFFYEASRYCNAALDISDGLSKDLSRMCAQSRLGVQFLEHLPKSVLCSGEEYEMLFAFPRRFAPKIQSIAKKHRIALHVVAKARRGRYKTTCSENHF